MTIPFSTPPEDVSPGSLNSPRFMNLSLSQLNKISLGLLKNKVTTAPEGTVGLQKAKEILAARVRAVIGTYIGGKNTLSLEEQISGVQDCVETIILCGPFLSPATFSRIRDFVDGAGVASERGGALRAILQDQAKLQGTVLRYGGVVSCKKTTNFPKEIRDLLNTLKKLPTTGQPKRLIELLEHPETAEVTWRQIGFHYQALKKNLTRTEGGQDDKRVA